MDTTLDAHGKGEGLKVRDKHLECTLVGRVHEHRAILALLTLALLHQKVVTAVAVKRKFAASCALNALLRAAVGLKFRHTDTRV